MEETHARTHTRAHTQNERVIVSDPEIQFYNLPVKTIMNAAEKSRWKKRPKTLYQTTRS